MQNRHTLEQLGILTSMRIQLVSFALLLSAGCLEATNPCDPDAPIELKSVTLNGTVRDPYGNGVSGVVVSVAGRSETAVSAPDGTFALAQLPAQANGYQLVATPAPPSLGSIREVPASVVPTCGSADVAIDLLVATAPTAPEPELVRAVSRNTMLVAFSVPVVVAPQVKMAGEEFDTRGPQNGTAVPVDNQEDIEDAGVLAEPWPPAEEREEMQSDVMTGGAQVGDDWVVPAALRATYTDTAASDYRTICEGKLTATPRAYRVQVRRPFGAWEDALVSVNPWEAASETPPDPAMPTPYPPRDALDSIDDMCAAAACSQFGAQGEAIRANTARCAVIVGTTTGPLEEFASYEVRVLTETRFITSLTRAGLPEKIVSPPAARVLSTSLVPNSLMKVIMPDASNMDEAMAQQAVVAVVPLPSGEFGIVADKVMKVVGADLGNVENGVPMNENEVSLGALAADEPAATPIVRALWKGNPATRPTAVTVENGEVRAVMTTVKGDDEQRVQQVQLRGALGELVSLNFSATPPTSITRLSTPPQMRAVVLNYDDKTVVLAHGRVPGNNVAVDTLSSRLEDFVGADDNRASDSGPCAAFAPDEDQAVCEATDGETCSTDDEPDGTRDRVFVRARCIPQKTLVTEVPPEAPEGRPWLAVANQETNSVRVCRVLDFVSDPACGTRIQVGLAPVAMRTVTDSIDGTNKVVVANRDSRDLSIIVKIGEEGGRPILDEVAIPLPVAPVDILTTAVTTEAPFLWVLGDDGRAVPVDMRTLSVPRCGDDDCSVSTRGRARVGAAQGARVVVGGIGMAAEIGFFRPLARLNDVGTADMP
jgi:hypothetical protein